MNKSKSMIKKIIFSLFFVSILSIFLFFSYNVSAQITGDPMIGLDDTARGVDAFKDNINATNPENFLETKTGQVVGVVLSFVGVIFLGLMIYAGLIWMTAEGNEQQVAKAKSLLVNSTIGIIIVFAAYAITSFIGDEIIK